MKHILKQLGFIAYSLITCAAHADTLIEHRWQHRLLLVASQSADETQAILAQLSCHSKSIQARRLIVYIAEKQRVTVYPQATGNTLPEMAELSARLGASKTTLIGLDGRDKARYPKTDLNLVLAKIDTMPMRQAELQTQ